MTFEELWEIIPKRYKYIAKSHGKFPELYLNEEPIFELGYTVFAGHVLLVDCDLIKEGVVYERPKKTVWVVPTDEDAKKRPKCRVRDCEDDAWYYNEILIGAPSDERFIDIDGHIWKFCEIEKEET